MKPLVSCPEVWSALQEAKQGARQFVTNLFPEPRKIETWIARRELFEAGRGRAAILLRQEEDFFHLYFAAAEPAALAETLRRLALPRICVSDLVGRPGEVEELAASLQTAGFRRYKSLQRLVRRPDPAASFSADPAVTYGTAPDAQAARQALCASFDRYAEQIPPPEEFLAAAREQRLLVLRQGNSLGGFLYFELQAQTAVVRYWFVSDACRGQGTGSKLMKTFFSLCPAARRVLLWVITTNENAIRKYQHYGFLPDALVDQVMIKEPAV